MRQEGPGRVGIHGLVVASQLLAVGSSTGTSSCRPGSPAPGLGLDGQHLTRPGGGDQKPAIGPMTTASPCRRAGRGKPGSVRADCHPVDPAGMTGEDRHQVAVDAIEDLDGRVMAGD